MSPSQVHRSVQRPTLCAVLRERVTDSDPENPWRGTYRSCAPRRGEHCAQLELDCEFRGDREAAGLLANPRFLPALRGLLARLKGENVCIFGGSMDISAESVE